MRKNDISKKLYLIILTSGGSDHQFFLVDENIFNDIRESDDPNDYFLRETMEDESIPQFTTVVEAFDYASEHKSKVIDEEHFLSY